MTAVTESPPGRLHTSKTESRRPLVRVRCWFLALDHLWNGAIYRILKTARPWRPRRRVILTGTTTKILITTEIEETGDERRSRTVNSPTIDDSSNNSNIIIVFVFVGGRARARGANGYPHTTHLTLSRTRTSVRDKRDEMKNKNKNKLFSRN